MSFDHSKLKSSVKNIKITAPSSIFREEGERIELLLLSSLVPFQNHPFKVLEDDSMERLKTSIHQFGVANPIIVRSLNNGTFEIVAGHRRVKACSLLGLEEIPAIVRELEEEEAIFQMVDTNIQREQLLPSEKAFAYQMKLEAAKRMISQKEQTKGVPLEHPLKSRELLAENSSDSSVQIQRYIRLTYLIPELLQETDDKKLPFRVAVELSYLSHQEQEFLQSLRKQLKKKPSLEQATKLRKLSAEKTYTKELVESILLEENNKGISLKMDIKQYFPENTSQEDIKKTIIELLENWKNQKT